MLVVDLWMHGAGVKTACADSNGRYGGRRLGDEPLGLSAKFFHTSAAAKEVGRTLVGVLESALWRHRHTTDGISHQRFSINGVWRVRIHSNAPGSG